MRRLSCHNLPARQSYPAASVTEEMSDNNSKEKDPALFNDEVFLTSDLSKRSKVRFLYNVIYIQNTRVMLDDYVHIFMIISLNNYDIMMKFFI